MDDLENGNGLRPLCELAYAGIGAAKAGEQDSEHDAAQDDGPEQGTDEIVEDQVPRLGRAGLEGFGGGISLGAWRRPHSRNWDMRERKRRRARGWKGWLGRARYCACCCAVFRSAPPHMREYLGMIIFAANG